MVDQGGQRTWAAETTAYGRVRLSEGARAECPFRFQGQYEDVETGLYYNRFRYYAPEEGIYVSQDPIRMRGGQTFYSYVKTPTTHLDILGLTCSHGTTATGDLAHFSGTNKPMLTGAAPNSVYTHVNPKTGRAVQNTVYDANGDVVGHVDFKNHGIESGHWHEFPTAGNPASGQGKGKPHNLHTSVPDGWSSLSPNTIPHTPVGT